MQLEQVLAALAPTTSWGRIFGMSSSMDIDWLFSMTFLEASEIAQAQELLTKEHLGIRDKIAVGIELNGEPCPDLLLQALYLAALRNILDAAALVGWDALPNFGKPPVLHEWARDESCNRLREWSTRVAQEAKRIHDQFRVS